MSQVELDAVLAREQAVPLGDAARLGDSGRSARSDEGRGVAAVGGERLVDGSRRTVGGEPDPEIPRGAQAVLEATERTEPLRVDDDGRGACLHGVRAEQLRQHRRRVGRARCAHDVSLRAHEQDAAVGPGGTRVTGCLELKAELVGRPEIVVVEESDPRAAGCLDPGVARGALPAARVEPDGPNTWVGGGGGEERGGLVVGAVVDDDHLDVDILLRERSLHGVGEEIRAVLRRDDDADVGPAAHGRAAGNRTAQS